MTEDSIRSGGRSAASKAAKIDRLLKLTEVKEMTGLGKTTIYDLMKRGQFPQQFKPGGVASRWSEAGLSEWLNMQRAPSCRAA